MAENVQQEFCLAIEVDMFLKQPVGQIILAFDYNDTYDTLLRELEEMGFEVKLCDKNKGVIIIRCLSKLVDMFFWRCWSEKLLFKLEKTSDYETKVNIYGIPNLFRIKIKERDILTDHDKLLSQLRQGLSIKKS